MTETTKERLNRIGKALMLWPVIVYAIATILPTLFVTTVYDRESSQAQTLLAILRSVADAGRWLALALVITGAVMAVVPLAQDTYSDHVRHRRVRRLVNSSPPRGTRHDVRILTGHIPFLFGRKNACAIVSLENIHTMRILHARTIERAERRAERWCSRKLDDRCITVTAERIPGV